MLTLIVGVIVSLEQNIKDRELFDYIKDEEPGERFWQLCSEHYASIEEEKRSKSETRSAKISGAVKMTDAEALRFEKMKMLFGIHEGVSVGNVPLDYLSWLSEQGEFYRKLNRYVAWRNK